MASLFRKLPRGICHGGVFVSVEDAEKRRFERSTAEKYAKHKARQPEVIGECQVRQRLFVAYLDPRRLRGDPCNLEISTAYRHTYPFHVGVTPI